MKKTLITIFSVMMMTIAAAELYKRFRGREASVDALLRRSGVG